MPLSIEDFRVPKFVEKPVIYPFGENKKDKFYATTGDGYIRRYRSGSFPQQGYNPNADVAEPKDVNINSDEYTLPPY